MCGFNNILVAVDMGKSANKVLARAAFLANSKTNISLLHALYSPIPIYGGYMGEAAYMNNNAVNDEASVRKDMRQTLENYAHEFNLSAVDIHVETGRTVDVILDVADEVSADLIVVGSHGRHGVALLLGSTANGVLHRTKCHVLAVRIND